MKNVPEFKVGDKVVIIGVNEYWNGIIVTIEKITYPFFICSNTRFTGLELEKHEIRKLTALEKALT